MKSYKKMCDSNKEIELELYNAIKEGGGGGTPTGEYYTKTEINTLLNETRSSIESKTVTSGEIRTDNYGVYIELN